MAISSKEISLTFWSIIASSLLGFYLYLCFNQIKQYIPIIIFLLIILAGIGIIIYMRINEINKELKKQESKQNQLDEKLNIYKRLAKIEEKLKI